LTSLFISSNFGHTYRLSLSQFEETKMKEDVDTNDSSQENQMEI